MLTLYLVALAVGGTLLLASLLLGGDGHGQAAGDVEAPGEVAAGLGPDVGVDAALDAPDAAGSEVADQGMGVDAALAWLPLASMRFWTFFLAFFGLTGTVLSAGKIAASPLVTGVIAVAVGYACGLGVVVAIRRMRASQTDSTAGVDDYVGASALVMVAVAPGKPGKVRLQVKGRTVELLAETEDETRFAVQEQALIYAVNERGRAVITRPDQAE